MRSRCLFCGSRFATNSQFPDLPIGRRIAFDPAAGRLWVVCRRCDGWNLTPFDRRIETIDRCEQMWRQSRRIDSTTGIVLFRTSTGVELIRVGEDSRAEFASWRLGERFKHRQWIRALQLGGGLGVIGLFVAGIVETVGLVVGAYGLLLLAFHLEGLWKRPVLRVPTTAGPWPLRRKDIRRLSWRPGPGGAGAVRVSGGPLWSGPQAALPLMLVMPVVNRWGGSRRQRDEAMALLESLGDPLRMFRHAAQHWPGKIRSMPEHVRLALEMAANEQAERDTVEGRLQLLAAAWQQAEEVAAVADSLLVPDWIDNLIRRWKSDPPIRDDAQSTGNERPRSPRLSFRGR